MGNLTAVRVKHAKPGDKLADGDGLTLDVDKNGNASWVFQFKSPVIGKERFMGLGPLRDIGLAEAREAASAARALVRNMSIRSNIASVSGPRFSERVPDVA
ncbi:Arm DNA-binding domain-containing protein [Bradyrhizobium sp. 186]|nr:Arm DNA-binding domain-containing protein [Bradyrhizobium sp. 186]